MDERYQENSLRLAISYLTGDGVAPDPARGARMIRQLCDEGYDPALYEMGLCCMSGDGVPADPAAAFRWFRRSAESGDLRGRAAMADCYRTGDGVAPDPKEALRCYRLCAEAGDVYGMLRMGMCCENGEGAARDMQQAVRWYRMAAARGSADAAYAVSRILSEGDGVPADAAESMRYLRMAVENGYETDQPLPPEAPADAGNPVASAKILPDPVKIVTPVTKPVEPPPFSPAPTGGGKAPRRSRRWIVLAAVAALAVAAGVLIPRLTSRRETVSVESDVLAGGSFTRADSRGGSAPAVEGEGTRFLLERQTSWDGDDLIQDLRNTYDGDGNLLRTQSYDSWWHTDTRYTLDASGRALSAERREYADGEEAEAETSTCVYVYDGQGRKIREDWTSEYGSWSWEYQYDPWGNLAFGGADSMMYSCYDRYGTLITWAFVPADFDVRRNDEGDLLQIVSRMDEYTEEYDFTYTPEGRIQRMEYYQEDPDIGRYLSEERDFWYTDGDTFGSTGTSYFYYGTDGATEMDAQYAHREYNAQGKCVYELVYGDDYSSETWYDEAGTVLEYVSEYTYEGEESRYSGRCERIRDEYDNVIREDWYSDGELTSSTDYTYGWY